ncbi:MAG: multiheme c-type cytochrome [Thermoanaerobaculia bacterium]
MKRPVVAGVLLIGLALCAPLRAQPPFFEYAKIDPNKVVTAEKCGECHIHEAVVWKTTPHATGFKTLHKKEQAETIAKKMGFRLIKRDSLCFSCHYTPVIQSGQIRVVSGVSCESCHGAGADYLDVHNDYGAAEDHTGESAAHRRQRIADSRNAGMRRPSDLYPVAANCFSCHSVPLERLVNEGGHTTGSAGFELVEWSQGQIRHNFLRSFRDRTDPVNRERSMSRKRVMYVVGRALDLEYSLRGMAKATVDGIYSKAMSRRVRSAVSELRAVSRAAGISQVDEMLAAVKAVRTVPGNEASLLAAADTIARATRSFLGAADASQLASLDDLVRGIEPEEDFEVAAADGTPAAGGGASGVRDRTPPSEGSSPGSTVPASSGGASAEPGARAASTGAAGVAGGFKIRIRPASQRRTIGPVNCAGCHTEQNQWWFGHEHSRSVNPFFDGDPDVLRIARLYGVKTSQMTTGRAVCMDCHGTILSGKESREVLDGVGCESCHGPAADWLEPHKNEAGKELGRQRPGHLAALGLGKKDLRQSKTRAETCTGCHYVTDRRLLSAGHPSGSDFDYVRGMNEVRHWQHRLADGEISSSARAVIASRGPVPDVRVATLPAGSSGGGRGQSASSSESSGSVRSTTTFAEQRRSEEWVLRPPTPRPLTPGATVGSAAGIASGGVDFKPLPKVGEASIEELLLAVQKRLRELYKLVSPTNVSAGRADGSGGSTGGSR